MHFSLLIIVLLSTVYAENWAVVVSGGIGQWRYYRHPADAYAIYSLILRSYLSLDHMYTKIYLHVDFRRIMLYQ